MDEVQYYEMQERNAMAEVISACAKAIFDHFEAKTMSELQRSIYKYTDCGAAVSFELHEGACGYEDDATEAPIGLDTPRKSPLVYCGDDRADAITEPWLSIRQIGVSSIVEGTDQEVPLGWIDLEQYCNDEKYEGDIANIAKSAVNDFEAMIIAVEDQAQFIWTQTHGCPSCAKHWLRYDPEFEGKGDDGITPIWDKCRKCKGQGSII